MSSLSKTSSFDNTEHINKSLNKNNEMKKMKSLKSLKSFKKSSSLNLNQSISPGKLSSTSSKIHKTLSSCSDNSRMKLPINGKRDKMKSSKSFKSMNKSTTSYISQESNIDKNSVSSKSSNKTKLSNDENDLTNNTKLFERNLKLYRKFRVAVKDTEDLIQQHHDRALTRVQERVMKETLESKVLVEVSQLEKENESIKEAYVLEADKAKEDMEQLRALKLYHQMHIQRLLPMWFKTLNDTTTCIACNGHSDKLQWRSKARKLLLAALKEMDDDDSAEVIKPKLRYLALSINARKAQQVLSILKMLREEYIRHKEGKSDLGHHSTELRRIKALLDPDKPCPLGRKQWSTDLESSITNVKKRTDESLLNHTARGMGSTIQSIDDDFTLATDDSFTINENDLALMSKEMVGNNSYDFSKESESDVMNESSEDPFPSESRKKNVYLIPNTSIPVDPHNTGEIMRLLRETSTQGLLIESWKIFSYFYGDYINNVKDKTYVHMNLKSVPTLETFKLLAIAFKNSDSDQFDDISTILILMKRAGIAPDLEFFNMVLRACERRGAWRRALKFLKVNKYVSKLFCLISNLNLMCRKWKQNMESYRIPTLLLL